MFESFFKKIIFVLFFCVVSFSSYAAVTHITGGNSGSSSSSISPNQEKSCYQQGYKKTSCPKGSVPYDLCATNDKYFKSCACDTEVYKYSKHNCDASTGASLAGGSCSDDNNDKLYKSCKCNAAFKVCQDGFVDGATLCIDDEGYKHNGCLEDVPTCESINYKSSVPVGYQCKKISNRYMTCYRDCTPL